ncbi:Uncharacterized protein DAT39_018626, partial [Clarias magur]
CVSQSESAQFSGSQSGVVSELVAHHAFSCRVPGHGRHPHQAQCEPAQSAGVFPQLTLHQ